MFSLFLVYLYIAALGGRWVKVGLCVGEVLQVRLGYYGGSRCGSIAPHSRISYPQPTSLDLPSQAPAADSSELQGFASFLDLPSKASAAEILAFQDFPSSAHLPRLA